VRPEALVFVRPSCEEIIAGWPDQQAENGWVFALAARTSPAAEQEDIMHFRISGLPAEHFAPLFALSDEELKERGAVRRIADGPRPCRISLTDASPGDELILVNYEHHAVASPYRMRFAIYVRPGEETFDAIDVLPEQLRTRTLAVRAFDADAMMIASDVTEGTKLEETIGLQFADPRAAYLHLHFAAPGCYAARIERAQSDARRYANPRRE
jgi:hypothetical protein